MSKIGLLRVAALGIAAAVPRAWAQTPIPPSPRDFVLAATQVDRYESLAARVAVAQSRNPRVRTFAEDMIRDHDRLDEALGRAAEGSGLPVSKTGLSGDQAMLLSALQGVRGPDFDRTYARQQVLVHAQAAAVAASFAAAGSDPGLRTAAQASLPVIEDHLRMARQLSADVGGS